MYPSTQFCLTTHLPPKTKLNPPKELFSQKKEQYSPLEKSPKDWFNFFYDSKIPSYIKKKEAPFFLEHYVNHLDVNELNWLENHTQIESFFYQNIQEIGTKFQLYLQRRKKYGREYFPTVAHAFEFLIKVAPIKYVDGAWLYSVLEKWQSKPYQDLILIYLEELGLGGQAANHVTIYQKLLEKYDLEKYIEPLDSKYYEQAAIQLALAYTSDEDLGWVVGFNLGYEQLPLHLLISNYELQELGIDSHYFNVHITIDNLHNGHAKRAIDAFQDAYNCAVDKSLFIQKVKQGYALNDIGISSNDIINELKPENFALQIFQTKALVGQYIHNEKCQYQGQSINQWLSEPQKVKTFLKVLIDKKFIVLGQPIQNSHFWKMIDQADGKMFGVFNATEKQIIKDWIQGENLAKPIPLFKAQYLLKKPLYTNDQHQYLTAQNKFKRITNFEEQIDFLKIYLSPHLHHTAIGLWATQTLSQLLFPFQSDQF